MLPSFPIPSPSFLLSFVLLPEICNKSLESRSGAAACNDFQLPRRATLRRCCTRRVAGGMLAYMPKTSLLEFRQLDCEFQNDRESVKALNYGNFRSYG